MESKYIRGMSGNQMIRFVMVNSTGVVEKARSLHDTTPVATAALGRTLTAASMLGLLLKGHKETVSIQVKGNGPARTVYATADSNGNVKGYIGNPLVDVPFKTDGKLDVGAAVGTDGEMIIIRDFGLKEPYVGRSKLTTGEIAEDLVSYFMTSEQQPSAISLGVSVTKNAMVEAAGGLLIQPLPNIDEETLTLLETTLAKMRPISDMVREGLTPEEIISEVLFNFKISVLDQGYVNFECDCQIERIEKGLISLGEKELLEIIEEDGHAETSCHFCNKKYTFDKEALESLLEEIRK